MILQEKKVHYIDKNGTERTRTVFDVKCDYCGKVFEKPAHGWKPSLRAGNNFCGRSCRTSFLHRERWGHCQDPYTTSDGYIWVYAGKDHPGANVHGRMMEHRYVMQEHLGRPLRSDEIVHHKDGNRSNNHLENLGLTSRSEHAAGHIGSTVGLMARIRQLEEENAYLHQRVAILEQKHSAPHSERLASVQRFRSGG